MSNNYEKFECKIQDDRWSDEGEKELYFTYNGFQGQAVAINPSIAVKLKKVIDEYLEEA